MLKRLVYINRNNKEKEREKEELAKRQRAEQRKAASPTQQQHHHRSRSGSTSSRPRVIVPASDTHKHAHKHSGEEMHHHTHIHTHTHDEALPRIHEDEGVAQSHPHPHPHTTTVTTPHSPTPNYTTTTAATAVAAVAAVNAAQRTDGLGSPGITPHGVTPPGGSPAAEDRLPFPGSSTDTNTDTSPVSTTNIENQLLFPAPTALLPYGDGSNKVFGYENFGNTCYCNSVLQCLYHLESVRDVVLEYPAPATGTIHQRKFKTESRSPRVFTKDSFDGSAANGDAAGDSEASGAEKKTSLKQALSRYGSEAVLSNTILSDAASFSSRKDKEKEKEKAGQNGGAAVVPAHTTVMSADSLTEKLHDSCKTIVVGRKETVSGNGVGGPTVPTSRGRALSKSVPTSPLIGNSGKTADFAAFKDSVKPVSATTLPYSSEQRKKAALMRGPVLHIDRMMTTGMKPNLYHTLKDIFECITENENLSGVVSPTQFVKTLKKENVLFNSSMQQDAHEFLNFLLNNLDDYLSFQAPSVPPHMKSFIPDEFQGTLSNRTKCLTCDTVTTGEEPFLDFPIEVLGQDSIDLQRVLRHYRQREILNGSNKFYCNQCYALQEAERLVEIEKLPRTLAINLKRFKYVEEQNANIKLFNKIYYPATLNVSTRDNSDSYTSYELTGVVVHLGGSPQHGHYVSLCKSKLFGWLLFDDETVESVDEATVLRFIGDSRDQTTAYVLFYQSIGNVDVSASPVDTAVLPVESLGQLGAPAEAEVPPRKASPSQAQYEANIAQLIKCDDLITETERREKRRHTQRRRSSVDGRITSDKGRHPAVKERNSKKGGSANKSKRKSRILSFMKS